MMKKILILIISFLAGTATLTRAVEPTHKDVRYSPDYERSTMDLWLPACSKPAPLIIFFHGGAFKAGNKSQIPFKHDLLRLSEKNIAIASVGYPLLGDQSATDSIGQFGYSKILEHTVLALRYLKENAEKYNIDPKRISVAGASAGALIAEYLTYNEDLDVSACIAIQQPYATQQVIKFIDQGEPPMLLFTTSGPNDRIHNPVYARQIKEHCDSVKVPCQLFGSSRSGLPQLPADKAFVAYAYEMISGIWENRR